MTNLEIRLLLEAIKEHYRYDFTEYKSSSLRRRLDIFLSACQKQYFSELIPLVLHNPDKLRLLINTLTIGITEMFRDPPIFRFIVEKIIPSLRSFSLINIWSAGCSTGQEPFSLSILMKEAGLLNRSHVFGTDINQDFINAASEGIYSEEEFSLYSKNYVESGCPVSLSEYFHVRYGKGIVNDDIRKHVSFFKHNLVTDHDFVECQLIMCSNVLIYFNKELQNKAWNLFYNSLHNFGYLVLGKQEKLPDHMLVDRFKKVSDDLPIYQKAIHG